MSVNQSRVVAGRWLGWFVGGLAAVFPVLTFAADLRVMTTSFPPYVIFDEATNEAHGPAVDVINRICVLSQTNCEIHVEPWARAYATALEQPNTLIFSIARRPDRETKFKWIGTVAPYQVRLFALDRNGVQATDNWRELSDFHVAGQLGDVKAQYLQNSGFDVEMVPSAEATIRMLYAGRADLIAGDALSLPYRVRMLDVDSNRLKVVARIPELSSDLYLAASLATDDDAVEVLRAALDQLKNSGSYDQIWAMTTSSPSN